MMGSAPRSHWPIIFIAVVALLLRLYWFLLERVLPGESTVCEAEGERRG